MQQKRYIPKPVVAALVFVLVIILISVLAMNGFFHRNPYGDAIKSITSRNTYQKSPRMIMIKRLHFCIITLKILWMILAISLSPAP